MKTKYEGKRFDLHIIRPAGGKYPDTLHKEGSFNEDSHVMCLRALTREVRGATMVDDAAIVAPLTCRMCGCAGPKAVGRGN